MKKQSEPSIVLLSKRVDILTQKILALEEEPYNPERFALLVSLYQELESAWTEIYNHPRFFIDYDYSLTKH